MVNKMIKTLSEKDKVLNFAKKYDKYVSVLKTGEWKDYSIYTPKRASKSVCYTGYPLKILVKDNEIRWTTPQEALEIFSK